MTWRRITILTAAILAALLVGTWSVLQRTGVAADFVRQRLRELLATSFHLHDAQVDLFGGSITLEDIAIADPARAGRQLVAADSVHLGVEADPLGNVLALHEVEVDGLRIDIDLTAANSPDLSRLLREQRAQTGVTAGIGEITPARLTRGHALIRVDDEVPELEFTDVELQLQRLHDDDDGGDRRRGALRGRAHCKNLGVDVELLGEIDLHAQRIRLQARMADLLVDAAFLRRLAPLLRSELRDDLASGKLEELLLQLELAIDGSAEAVASSSFAFADVTCSVPEVPVPLRSASVRGTVSTENGGTARFTGTRLLPTGQTEVTAKIAGFFTDPHLEVRGSGRGIRIDDTVRAALRSFHAGQSVVDGLRPTTGEADFDLYLRIGADVDQTVDLDVQLQGVALSYHGFGPEESRAAFPLPVVNAQGRVHLRDDVVSIEDVTAELAAEAGGGQVTIAGRVDPKRTGSEQVSIDLEAPRIQFTPALRSALAQLVRDDGVLYDQFAPEGAAAVRLRVRPTPDQASTWQVVVSPLGARARWIGFPLPLSDVHGQIIARSEGLQIDLDASYGGGTAELRGRLMAPLDQQGSLTLGSIDLRIRGKSVPLDQEMRRATTALAPKLDAVWQELAPRGRADTTLYIRRDEASGDLLYDLALDLHEGHALPRSFPLPVTRAKGQVFVHGRGEEIHVQVDAVRGLLQERRSRPAELAVVGTLYTGPDGYREDLTAVVRGLELDTELGATLERTGAVGKGTWDVLRPSGIVDLILRQGTKDGATEREYDVLLRGVRSDAEMLPMPATDAHGELQVAGGVLRFSDLRAQMGPVLVSCGNGYVGPSTTPGRSEVAFTVSSQGFPLDDTFARLFVGPMKQAVLDRQLRGALDIHGLSLRFLLPQDGTDQPIETVLQGSVSALDVEMLLGTRLQQLNGNVSLEESHVTQQGGTIRGNFSKGSLVLLSHPFGDASADFEIQPEAFQLRDLKFTLHGGNVGGRDPQASALTYVFGDEKGNPGRLSADLEFGGVSLREFLVHCGVTGTPLHGTARGKVQLGRLDGFDFVDMQGRGELAVDDGNLGNVPLFTAIYALMAEKNRPRFESLAATFDVKDRKVELSDLVLRSPLIALRGGGEMSMEGYLDVTVTTDNFLGGGADLLLLPPVIQMITSNLVRFHLFGHLRDMQAEQRWFAQRDPRRQRLQPVPPRLERPVRPDF